MHICSLIHTGNVFQYSIILEHTEASQTPAHHILIDLYLPYMDVYQDFIPTNDSRVPNTKIISGLGIYEADSILQLYLYKLEMDDIIEGTFLIQISTKLTMGRYMIMLSILVFFAWFSLVSLLM